MWETGDARPKSQRAGAWAGKGGGTSPQDQSTPRPDHRTKAASRRKTQTKPQAPPPATRQQAARPRPQTRRPPPTPGPTQGEKGAERGGGRNERSSKRYPQPGIDEKVMRQRSISILSILSLEIQQKNK